MPIRYLKVEGYRSVRKLEFPLQRVNVLVGSNGCGKSNLYRSIWLLSEAARGRFAQSLVEEGGMPSVLWAGKRRAGPVRLTLSLDLEQLSYTLSCGLPQGDGSMFDLDPQFKEESIEFIEGRKRTQLLERGKHGGWARDSEGRRVSFPMALLDSESVLTQLREPHRFPQLSALREELLGWRFYHQFRTDAESPLRRPQPGCRTVALAPDGRDLAAALQTIDEIGRGPELRRLFARALGGASYGIVSERGYFSVQMKAPEIQQPFPAQALSDGTLRLLCLGAALFSPRPPAVLALNEPETSLHPDLIPALAELIAQAAEHSQLWITTHSSRLAQELGARCGVEPLTMTMVEGETRLA